MKSVTFIVIGLIGAVRSKSLLGFLGSEEKVHLIEPVLFEAIKYAGHLATDFNQKLLQGRTLSSPEVGCALAHRAAVRKAQNLFGQDKKLEWVVIAEDDADLSEEGARWLARYLGNWVTQAPALVNFYRPRQSESPIENLDERPPRRQLVLRPGTVCYAINRSGLNQLQLFADSPVGSVADWPLFFADLKFFFTSQFSVSEYPGESTIGVRKRSRVCPRLIMVTRQIIRIPYLMRIHRTSFLGSLIWVLSPLFRDLYHRLAGAHSGKSKLEDF